MDSREPDVQPRPLVLFYNPAWDRWPDADRLAEAPECEFTTDRRRLPEARAIVFHLPTLAGIERVPKYPGQLWVAWSMESAANCPRLADPAFMRHFEISMTYRRAADVWTPYFGPDVTVALRQPPRAKTAVAPAVYLQSSRFNASGRVQYAAELMKRVKVDSYGAVLQNRRWPIPDAGPAAKRELIARYKFTLAFENSIAPDYVTEKLYDPLIAGSVPVYLGAPNVRDFAPAEGCFINAADFDGPAALAAHLNWLDENDAAYAAHLAWKAGGPDARFLEMVAAVRRDPFSRLAALVAARARGAAEAGRGRPHRPLRAPWRHAVSRMISRFREPRR
jgi:hypothetical protein